MKKVFWVSSDDKVELEKLSCEQHKQKKSNLVFVMGKDDECNLQTCPICLCDYENDEDICWSNNENCSHHFHAACGIAWLAKHSECPVCRAEYLIPVDIEKTVDSPAPEGDEPQLDLEAGLRGVSIDFDSSPTMSDVPDEEAEQYLVPADAQLRIEDENEVD
eukprot:CAMPEP_0176031546 /NCGR_PEP_ID=MMETSP0120_2-20121206/15553_1 /TAXON_ID=160619 /ORGANISM="Kryptoperidinium foliaceum, Strain CCMP 1326" /LENGTH=161 /DNA_ID=CAMNT_0017364839 /DNA_START=457 /DNA_END=939 /DNA_ORIENTATION=+